MLLAYTSYSILKLSTNGKLIIKKLITVSICYVRVGSKVLQSICGFGCFKQRLRKYLTCCNEMYARGGIFCIYCPIYVSCVCLIIVFPSIILQSSVCKFQNCTFVNKPPRVCHQYYYYYYFVDILVFY